MASGVESINIDLDSVFDLFVTGETPAAATHIGYGGTEADLNTRYRNLLYGTAHAATGIEDNGADLNTFFCAYGSGWRASLPSYPNEFNPPSASGSMTVTLTGGPGGTYTYVWSVVSVTGVGSFTIHSGAGTPTITWTLYASYDGPAVFIVTCTVTATNGAVVKASTTLRMKTAS